MGSSQWHFDTEDSRQALPARSLQCQGWWVWEYNGWCAEVSRGSQREGEKILQAYPSLSFLFLTNEKYVGPLSFVKV